MDIMQPKSLVENDKNVKTVVGTSKMSFRRLSAALNNFNRIRTECQRPERASIHTLHLIEFDLSTLIHFHSHWSLS